jgi:hypothetical protein
MPLKQFLDFLELFSHLKYIRKIKIHYPILSVWTEPVGPTGSDSAVLAQCRPAGAHPSQQPSCCSGVQAGHAVATLGVCATPKPRVQRFIKAQLEPARPCPTSAAPPCVAPLRRPRRA